MLRSRLNAELGTRLFGPYKRRTRYVLLGGSSLEQSEVEGRCVLICSLQLGDLRLFRLGMLELDFGLKNSELRGLDRI